MGPAAASSSTVARSSPSGVPTPNPAERRCSRRFDTDDLVILSPRFSGRVVDLSSTGLRVATTTRLTPGEQLSFRLVGEHRTVAAAIVRWCQLDSVFETGSGEILSLYQAGMALLREPRRLSPATPDS